MDRYFVHTGTCMGTYVRAARPGSSSLYQRRFRINLFMGVVCCVQWVSFVSHVHLLSTQELLVVCSIARAAARPPAEYWILPSHFAEFAGTI